MKAQELSGKPKPAEPGSRRGRVRESGSMTRAQMMALSGAASAALVLRLVLQWARA